MKFCTSAGVEAETFASQFGLEVNDYRNPACIADYVVVNVGDITGTGAVLFRTLRRVDLRRVGARRLRAHELGITDRVKEERDVEEEWKGILVISAIS